MKRVFCIILCLLFTAGCTDSGALDKNIAESSPTSGPETTLGYIPSELPTPEWLGSIWGWDTYGDTIWLEGKDRDGALVAASYDTLNAEWQRFAVDTEDAHYPIPVNISVAEDSLWILFSEGITDLSIKKGIRPENLGYYVFYLNLDNGISTCTRVDFDIVADTEADTPVLFSLQALDGGHALLTTYETVYLIDPEAKLLDRPELPMGGRISHMWVKDQLYVRFNQGYAPYNEESGQFGKVIPVREKVNYSSNAGNILTAFQNAVCKYDPASGERTELFKWMDVALSYSGMGGKEVFENSAGEFFYPSGSSIVKITQGQINEKRELILACFGDTSDEAYQYQAASHAYSDELMDAIIRFNNTDPEFRIRIKSIVYNGEAERERAMVELATAEDIDLVDTSFLPENAIKEGLMVDLLPYIDADEELDRDDFIQPLLNAMIKNGALYEYTDKFTLLSMLSRPEHFPGRKEWTTDYMTELIIRQPEFDCLSREQLIESFLTAATAEFINWNTMTCSFNSTEFQNWLSFLKARPETIEGYEHPVLIYPTFDFAGVAGPIARIMMRGDDYIVTGFPEAEGTGSYFIKLTNFSDPEFPTIGSNTRVGILASGKHHDGAWRFIRTLMLGGSEVNIMYGIPAFKESFERGIDSLAISLRNENQAGSFTEQDAHILREQVYNTTRLVHNDETLINIMRSEALAYFDGQKSVEDAARQIQSRVSIYLAEQG